MDTQSAIVVLLPCTTAELVPQWLSLTLQTKCVPPPLVTISKGATRDGDYVIFCQRLCLNLQESFDGAKSWVTELRNKGEKDCVIALAGNKCDLHSERQVDIDVREPMILARLRASKFF